MNPGDHPPLEMPAPFRSSLRRCANCGGGGCPVCHATGLSLTPEWSDLSLIRRTRSRLARAVAISAHPSSLSPLSPTPKGGPS